MLANESTRKDYTRVYLAFAGFYDTLFSDLIDRSLEYDAAEVSDALGDEAAEELYSLPNWKGVRTAIAKNYCCNFGDWLEKATAAIAPDGRGIDGAVFSFCGLLSPTEYNFMTDVIEADVSTTEMRALYAWVKRNFNEAWREYFKERTASRSGFISFYDSGDPDAYGPIEQWPACLIQLVFDFIDAQAEQADEFLRADVWYCDDAYSVASEALYSSSAAYAELMHAAWAAKEKEA